MKRRDFIGYGTVAGAGLLVGGRLKAQGGRTPGATVKTTAGQVRGYVDNGVQVFKSVPYGASTAGSNRFMPPQKPQPWSGVRDAFEYEGRAPQVVGGGPAAADARLVKDPGGEERLALKAIRDVQARPVA